VVAFCNGPGEAGKRKLCANVSQDSGYRTLGLRALRHSRYAMRASPLPAPRSPARRRRKCLKMELSGARRCEPVRHESRPSWLRVNMTGTRRNAPRLLSQVASQHGASWPWNDGKGRTAKNRETRGSALFWSSRTDDRLPCGRAFGYTTVVGPIYWVGALHGPAFGPRVGGIAGVGEKGEGGLACSIDSGLPSRLL
jgi:hypothetical protein